MFRPRQIRSAKDLTDCVHGYPLFWLMLTVPFDENILTRLLEICLEYRVDLNHECNGYNILHYSIEKFDFHLNRQDSLRLTRLQSLLKKLKEARVNPDLENQDGDDILKHALKRSAPESFVSFLIQDICGPQVINRRNKTGLTPFHLAAKFCSEIVMNLLVNKGANPLAQDNDGNNALHFILQQGHWRQPFTATRIVMNVLDNIPNGKRIVKEEFPDILIQFLWCIKRQVNGPSIFRLNPIVILVNEYGIDVNYSLTKDGTVFDAVREAMILHNKRPQLLDLLLGLNPVVSVNHIIHCLKLGQGISCLSQILKLVPDGKKIVKQEFPDILVHYLRCMKLHNVWDPDLFSFILNEYEIDINYTSADDGSVLHWLALFISSDFHEEARIELLTELLEKYGSALNLNVMCKNNFYPWSDCPTLVTPLQVAIQSHSFRFANVLIRNFASIDNLHLPPAVSINCDGDAAFHRMLRMLKFLGSSEQRLDDLKRKYLSFQKLQKLDALPSLLELACRSFRRKATKEQALSLIQQFDLGSNVKEYIFMDHMKELQFPKPPKLFVRLKN